MFGLKTCTFNIAFLYGGKLWTKNILFCCDLICNCEGRANHKKTLNLFIGS